MNIAAEMSRLADEIINLRAERKEKTQTRRVQVEELLARFDRDLAAMSKKSQAELNAFTTNLKNEVSEMLDTFDRQHTEMATKSKTARQKSTADLKKNVEETLSGYARDLSVARQQWKSISDKPQAKPTRKSAMATTSEQLASLSREFGSETDDLSFAGRRRG